MRKLHYNQLTALMVLITNHTSYKLLTAYRNLTTPYPTVPSPTLYDVPFSHNTKRYRQTDDRTSYHKRDSTSHYGRLKSLVKRLKTMLPSLPEAVKVNAKLNC